MEIAVLGWGSLIWQPGELPVVGDWLADGPDLPLEFARESQDGRMTLVLVEGSKTTRTLWAKLDALDVEAAVSQLAMRENTKPVAIGSWPSIGSPKPYCDEISKWAAAKGLAGVVWTALPPGFKTARGTVPTLDATCAHLNSLTGASKDKAVEYIEKAPPQVQTPYRSSLEIALNIDRNIKAH